MAGHLPQEKMIPQINPDTKIYSAGGVLLERVEDLEDPNLAIFLDPGLGQENSKDVLEVIGSVDRIMEQPDNPMYRTKHPFGNTFVIMRYPWSDADGLQGRISQDGAELNDGFLEVWIRKSPREGPFAVLQVSLPENPEILKGIKDRIHVVSLILCDLFR